MNSFVSDIGPIGSDFESLREDQLTQGSLPPWERDARPTAYVETGRQALALIAEVLTQRGRNRLVLPGLFCASMIEPFVERGWQIVPFSLQEDLRVPENASRTLVEEPERTVVLLMAYFGRCPDVVHREFAIEARRLGAVVIEDETHRVFHPGAGFADYRFASLRKLLPLAEGAYLQGDDEVLNIARKLAESDSRRWTAMDTKRDSLAAGNASTFREGFLIENERLEDGSRRYAASARSVSVLRMLPYESMAQTREANAAFLRERLSARGIASLPTVRGETPSHLVLRVSNPKLLQERLARRGVYCAIHWAQVEGAGGIAKWPSDLLSVPIDHRYDLRDMKRVSDVIIEEVA